MNSKQARTRTSKTASLNHAAKENGFSAEITLDPNDWASTRALAHKALDDALDFVQFARERPVWQPVPGTVRKKIAGPLPFRAQPLEETYREFEEQILPYSTGNTHPRFLGWVHGSGTVAGIVSEMLAATMNSNCGGRDHGAVYVERRVLDWCKQMLHYPASASGLLVSGTSMATFVALTVARNSMAGYDVRQEGLKTHSLILYTSAETHESALKAAEVLGLGRTNIRRIAVDSEFRMDLQDLQKAITADRKAGRKPFCIVGTAGTVNTGAIDDLAGIAALARRERLWFHIDGAFGALAVLNEELRPKFKGLELADSIAFDFHKWLHVPYDCGCVLMRDGELHWRTFTSRPSYLEPADCGLSGGGRWFCEYGPELSRGFRALKVWFTLKTYGVDALAKAILQNCQQAQYLGRLIKNEPELELSTEPSLNIVCFRFRGRGTLDGNLDELNERIVSTLQIRGIAAPSTTRIKGRLTIRVNLTNHRTRRADLALLVASVLETGREIAKRSSPLDCAR